MTNVLLLLLSLSATNSFLLPKVPRISGTAIHYDYFKKNKDGEKKDVSRLWKNIIFPGIYFEYADTKEPLKTVKVETKQEAKSNRYSSSDDNKTVSTTGTYNVADVKSVPVYSSTIVAPSKSAKPIRRPANFVPPIPKKALVASSGKSVSVLPSIQSFKRPKQPIVLYEFEADSKCKLVRLACSMLDLAVEFRPCPGTQ